MDSTTLLPFPNASADPLERDLAEIDAAIGLVEDGIATRVRLVGLVRPEAVAAAGLARAQEARIEFRLDRSPESVTAITLGPRT
jgi:hypothetical protein